MLPSDAINLGSLKITIRTLAALLGEAACQNAILSRRASLLEEELDGAYVMLKQLKPQEPIQNEEPLSDPDDDVPVRPETGEESGD